MIVHFDEDCGQPDEDSGGLLGSWLGQLSNDVNLLPIDYADWRVFAPHRKDKAWDIIQVTKKLLLLQHSYCFYTFLTNFFCNKKLYGFCYRQNSGLITRTQKRTMF